CAWCAAARLPRSSPCCSYRRGGNPLYSVLDALAVEHAEQRRPVLVAARTVGAVELLGAGLCRVIALQLHVVQAARHRIDLDLASAVEVVHRLERTAHRLAE